MCFAGRKMDPLNNYSILAFRYSVSEHENLLGPDLLVLLEVLDMIDNHVFEVLNDLPRPVVSDVERWVYKFHVRAAFLQPDPGYILDVLPGNSTDGDRDRRRDRSTLRRRVGNLDGKSINIGSAWQIVSRLRRAS